MRFSVVRMKRDGGQSTRSQVDAKTLFMASIWEQWYCYKMLVGYFYSMMQGNFQRIVLV